MTNQEFIIIVKSEYGVGDFELEEIKDDLEHVINCNTGSEVSIVSIQER